MNKRYDELAVEMVISWLNSQSNVSTEMGRTSLSGSPKTVKEVAQAYIDFSYVIVNGQLPDEFSTPEQKSND